MNIKIKCNDEFITHILDENYKEIRVEKSNSFNVLLDRDYFIYFSILDKKSEVIRLSNLLTSLEVKYFDDKEKLEVNINSENYGEVKVIKLKDEKNLFFREDKEKVINILLPFNYDKNKKYGLILMFDSQNIYDINKVGKYTLLNDPYGGWQVDSTLSIVKEKYGKEYIVVGIEDADKYRATELTPSSKIYKFKEILKDLDEESLLDGEMDHFDDFINETLLPYVFNEYSIDMNEIGIIGASSGGLASYYIGLKNYLKYKFIFTFTPATGFIEDESLFEFYKNINMNDKLPYIFYYQGNKGFLENILYEVNKDLINNLVKSNYKKENIYEYIEESYDHNEVSWRFAFNYFVDVYLRKCGK